MSSEPPAPKDAPSYQKGVHGQSAEWMREITRRRMEMAKTDPSKKGGRPKTRFTKKEVTEQAAAAGAGCLKVLETQLKSPDERVAQSAAKPC